MCKKKKTNPKTPNTTIQHSPSLDNTLSQMFSSSIFKRALLLGTSVLLSFSTGKNSLGWPLQLSFPPKKLPAITLPVCIRIEMEQRSVFLPTPPPDSSYLLWLNWQLDETMGWSHFKLGEGARQSGLRPNSIPRSPQPLLLGRNVSINIMLDQKHWPQWLVYAVTA